MKKSGFTLAEVLITLGIIGVVAALTAPALVQNTANAQVGPTLAKVTSTIENANQKLMLDDGVQDLKHLTGMTSGTVTEKVYIGDGDVNMDKYADFLTQYIMGSSYEKSKSSAFKASDDSGTYKIYKYNSSSTTKGKVSTGALVAYDDDSSAVMVDGGEDGAYFKFSNSVDILLKSSGSAYSANGSFKGPFAYMFVDINGFETSPNTLGKDTFCFYIDRSGSVVPVGSKTYAWLTGNESDEYTATSGDFACNATTVISGYGCAGSILDNNRKVIYQ